MRISKLVLAATLATFGLLAGGRARAQEHGAPSGGSTELKFGTLAPENTPWSDILANFKRELQKTTKGKMKVRLFLNGVLGDEAEMLKAMKIGQLTGGGFSTGGLSTVVRELQVFELPFLFESDDEADFVMDEVVLDDMRAACERQGLYLYIWAVNGWIDFGSKDKPIRGLADLKGAKAFMQETDIQRAFWNAVGANPVAIPVPDVLGALQRGMVNVYTTTPIFGSAAQWSTQSKYWTISHHVYQPAAVVFDLAWWNALSEENKKVILGFAPKLQQDARKNVRGIDEGILEQFKKQGITIETLPAEGRAELKKACEGVPAELIKAGVFKQELYDKVVKALAERRAKKGAK